MLAAWHRSGNALPQLEGDSSDESSDVELPRCTRGGVAVAGLLAAAIAGAVAFTAAQASAPRTSAVSGYKARGPCRNRS